VKTSGGEKFTSSNVKPTRQEMSTEPVPKRLLYDFTFDPSASSFNVSQQTYLAAHPDAGYMHIATGAFVFDNTDLKTPRVLLVQRSASDSMPNRWEIPGGGVDDEDESILHAVARELWEETGLEARHISGPVGTPHIFSSRSGKQICKFKFVVQAESNAEGQFKVKLNPEEHQRFVWASEIDVRAKKVKDVELEFTVKRIEDTILTVFKQLEKKEGDST